MDHVSRLALLCLGLAMVVACRSAERADSDPRDEFLARIAALEGRAFEGRVVLDEPAQADSPFAGRVMVMHVKRVEPGRIEIPFDVGEDRSRTWVLTRTESGLRLKHDHRQPDGTEDELSQYGGDALTRGSALRQEFPADTFSRALFGRTRRAVSVTNVWAMEVDPGRSFAYELSRPGRAFRVEFDLTRPVAPPAERSRRE